MTGFKTYVYSKDGYFYARVRPQRRSEVVARAAIRTALVARDMLDPKNRVPLILYAMDPEFVEWATVKSYKMRLPLGVKLPKSTVGKVKRDMNALVVNNDFIPMHFHPIGTVVRVASDPAYQGYEGAQHVYTEGLLDEGSYRYMGTNAVDVRCLRPTRQPMTEED